MVYYVATANFEFLIYIAVVLILGDLLFGTIRKTDFPPHILWGRGEVPAGV